MQKHEIEQQNSDDFTAPYFDSWGQAQKVVGYTFTTIRYDLMVFEVIAFE